MPDTKTTNLDAVVERYVGSSLGQQARAELSALKAEVETLRAKAALAANMRDHTWMTHDCCAVCQAYVSRYAALDERGEKT